MAALSLSGIATIGRALRNRNYRLFAIGNLVSLIGTWMQKVAVGWLAWELTGSAAWLGLIAFADLFPTVVCSPFAGALADRLDKLKVNIVTKSLVMLQAGLLALLTFTDLITIEILFALELWLGVAQAFNQPSRLALIPSLVPRDDLAGAVALNSLTFNLARFIGPAIAGIVIVAAGVAPAFAANAACILIFVVQLAMLRLDPAERVTRKAGGRLVGDAVEGYRYIMRHPGLAPLFAVMLAVALLARHFIELMPGFAADVFERGADGLAMLTSVTGIGAMIGGAWLAQRTGIAGLTRVVATTVLVLAVALLGFTATGWFWLALPCIGVAGFAVAAHSISAQTLLQSAVDKEMRGRVMAVYGVIFRGGPAVGALTMGVLAEQFGLRLPTAAGAALCILVWLWALKRRGQMARALEEDGATAGAAAPGVTTARPSA